MSIGIMSPTNILKLVYLLVSVGDRNNDARIIQNIHKASIPDMTEASWDNSCVRRRGAYDRVDWSTISSKLRCRVPVVQVCFLISSLSDIQGSNLCGLHMCGFRHKALWELWLARGSKMGMDILPAI